MGQHQNKIQLNQQFFSTVYEQNLSHEYFTHTKGFGYRKTNIRSANRQQISLFLKNNSHNLEEHKASEKMIMKKQFKSSTYPYSCIGLIIISYKDKYSFGTGCLIGPNLVLTAASNVYHKDTDDQPEVIHFVLDINQGEGDVYRVKRQINIPEKYVEEATGSHRYNYAVLEIERQESINQIQNIKDNKKEDVSLNQSNFPGLLYGYLGINTKFSGLQNIYIYGYSIDISDKRQMKFTIRGEKLDKLMCKNGSIGYKMESHQSQCGSPILIRRNEYFHIAGIHICGKKDLGTGLQVDESMRKAINNWIVVKEGRMDLSGKGIDSKSLSLLNSKDWRYLTMLNLDNNNLTSSGLIVLTKTSWPVLRELHICSNNVTKLDFDTSSIINLQVLYLSKNQIKELITISELAILRVLELSDNKIDDISQLIPLKYLERLYLNGNKLYKIPPEIQKWTELKKLQLSRNDLEDIPRELLKLSNLSVISLDLNASKFEKNEVIKQLASNNVEIILK